MSLVSTDHLVKEYRQRRVVNGVSIFVEPGEIEFILNYEPWDAGGMRVSEEKRIRMVPGTNFFQVTATLAAPGDPELTFAIGLSTVDQPAVKTDAALGQLSLWEKQVPDHAAIGTAVVVDPATLAGYAQDGKDRVVLVRVKASQPFTYYVGAGWAGHPRIQTAQRWDEILRNDATWLALNTLYVRKP